MKTYILALLCLSSIASSAQFYADKIPHFPIIGNNLATNIAAHRAAFISYPNYAGRLLTTEGQASDQYTAAQSASDYFAVYLKTNSSFGRLLRITMSEDFYGLVGIPSVQDVRTGQQFVMSLSRYDTRTSDYDYTTGADGYMARLYHLGNMNIDGETIFVKVRYNGTQRYPSMQLTWGQGASHGEPGFFKDHLEGGPVSTNAVLPRPQIHWSTMAYVDDEVYPIFPITIAEVSSERAYAFEVSEDLKSWKDATSVYVENNTNNNHQIWGIIHEPGTDKQFVRMKTTEW